MDYYNPSDINAEDLIKRVRIGNATQEFIRTPTGSTIIERAIQEYRKRGILDEDNNVIKNHMVTPVEFDADESVGRRNYYGQPIK